MRDLIGSDKLGAMSDALGRALHLQAATLYRPNARKSDKDLRSFTIREMADLCLRMKYNTLRTYLKSIEGLPQGTIEAGNRRMYTLDEIHEIQQLLYEAGKIPVDLYPNKIEGELTTKLLIYNLKGGVSKTTTAVNLSQLMAARGFKVLVIDLDPQASCSDLFDVRADIDNLPSIYDVLRYESVEDGVTPIPIADAIQATYFPNIDIVPGSINLTEFEYETASAASRGIPFYSRIADALEPIEDAYDIVIYDTPPHMSFCVIAALYASNSMLIPLSAGMLDVVSLVKFLDLASSTLESIEEVNPGKRFDFIRILLTRYAPNDSAQLQLASFLRNTLGSDMTNIDFLQSTVINDSGNTMEPVLEISPTKFTRKTYDRILDSLQGIALEMEREIMVGRGRITDEEVA
ncbi:hypothetical protein LCGC14_1260290 [marine sediment metagenome]|uniref:AAA domain-containing protein n=1 Tax=marine sediment metagenome TaxID=412755 RepID=A0A0F9LMA0_9ZZZZ|tara:strand:+ start:3711 stop:4925 length:1215 start_codon:yes stop_codon:yes gene_type:complete